MQFDIDNAIGVLQLTGADTVEYKIVKEIDGQKYLIKIRIEEE